MKAAVSEPLIDTPAIRTGLEALGQEHGLKSAKLRPAVSTFLKARLAEARELAEERLLRDGHGTACAESLAQAEDEIIHALFDFAGGRVFLPAKGQTPESIAVVAVGGYGRGTLAPGSDIDLLFVLPAKQTP